MAEDKMVPREGSFNEDNSDYETTEDDESSSECEVSEDSSITEESSDEDTIEYKAMNAVRKMHVIESFGRAIASIEKDIEELELRRTKVTCPVALMIMDGHKDMLFGFRRITQMRLEEIKHGVRQVHGDLQVKETTTDENPKKDSVGTFPLGGSFSKQGLEGKCMLDLMPDSSLKEEKELEKGDDDKQLGSIGSIAEIRHQKTQYTVIIGNFDPVAKLLSVNRAEAKGLKKGKVGDVVADLNG